MLLGRSKGFIFLDWTWLNWIELLPFELNSELHEIAFCGFRPSPPRRPAPCAPPRPADAVPPPAPRKTSPSLPLNYKGNFNLNFFLIELNFRQPCKKRKNLKLKKWAGKQTQAMELQTSSTLFVIINTKRIKNKKQQKAKRTPWKKYYGCPCLTNPNREGWGQGSGKKSGWRKPWLVDTGTHNFFSVVKLVGFSTTIAFS